ncbi:MAG: hypothetical protein QY314_03885 [Candidatus Dojkabacteria bacterium]|nr:MAG: hypothetical protein QY314_03885 [Candidatus Dojkabacteria bacterium]
MPEWETPATTPVQEGTINEFHTVNDTLDRNKAYSNRLKESQGQGLTSFDLFLRDLKVIAAESETTNETEPPKKRKKLKPEQKAALQSVVKQRVSVVEEKQNEEGETIFVINDHYPPAVIDVWRSMNRAMKSGKEFSNNPNAKALVNERYSGIRDPRLSSSDRAVAVEIASEFQRNMLGTCITMYEKIYIPDNAGQPNRKATMQEIERAITSMINHIVPPLHRAEAAQRRESILAEFSAYVYFREQGYDVSVTKSGTEDLSGVDLIAKKGDEVIYIDTKTGSSVTECHLPVIQNGRNKHTQAQSIALQAEEEGRLESRHYDSAVKLMGIDSNGLEGRDAPTSLRIVTMPPNNFMK